jgi:hypothetical protein
VKILHRISRAIARIAHSPVPAVGGGTVGANVDLKQIETVQQREFETDESEESE